MTEVNTLSDIDEYLRNIRPDIKTVKWFFALQDMQKLMEQLGNPQEKPEIIHIAGTSGKTSTAYYLSDMLRATNKKIGLTVSPHVDSILERVQINNSPLAKEEFINLFGQFIQLPAIKKMNITYFGLMVAFAFYVFAQKKVDYAVIEVGMGGRLDATNVITNPGKICVITDIGLDHTQFLGKDLRSIATEKAGIIQPNNQVFVAEQPSEVMQVFESTSKKQSATLHVMPADKIASAPGVLAEFQKRNWALANTVFEYIESRDNLQVINALDAPRTVPARMESINVNDALVVLDGSHNAQKITTLSTSLQKKYPNTPAAILFSMVDGKDESLYESLRALRRISGVIIVTAFTKSQDVYRNAMEPKHIEKQAQLAGFDEVIVVKDPKSAFELLRSRKEKLQLVTGSFFLLNHVRPLMKKQGLL